jgi:hypothetical protein
MRERTFWMITIMLLIWAALFLVAANAVRCDAQKFAAHNNALATSDPHAEDEVGSTRAASGPPTDRHRVCWRLCESR